MAGVRARNKAVDAKAGSGYKAALFFMWALTAAATPVWAGNGLVVKGAILPPGSQRVSEEEDRYKSPSSYADTLTFYSKHYKNNPRKTIVNQLGIRGVHLVNDGRGEWEGLNIYELDGETRIFVVPRDKDPAKGSRKRP